VPRSRRNDPDMSHLLVLGGAGSGKSTFLADEVAARAAAGRGAEVLALLPGREELRLFAELVVARSGRKALAGPRLMSPGALAREVLLAAGARLRTCLLYTSPSPRDRTRSRMPSSA